MRVLSPVTDPSFSLKRTVVIAAFRNSTDPKRKALVAGASGRMVAEALTRLGFECSVADLYGDRDTHQICEGRVTKLEALSDLGGKEQLVRDHEFVVFAGGLEGSASLAQKLARWSEPVFTSGESLERLADYRILNQAMSEAGVDRYPFSQNPYSIDSGQYVFKNLRHSATARFATTEDQVQSLENGRVVQPYICGETISLIFVASDGTAKCLGETKQLAEPTNELTWVGSIAGSWFNSDERVAAIRFANSITSVAGLVGVFGVDFVRTKDGVWPVDVNPRIPASAEVVGDHVIRSHLQAFGVECNPIADPDDRVWGKQVIFNRTANAISFREEVLEGTPFRVLDSCSPMSIADVPQRGEIIAPNHPICTVLASGGDEEEVRLNLAALQSRIFAGLGFGKQ